jgi:hypothetical protein
MTAAFLLGYRVHFSWLNNSNEIIQFRCLDPDINNNGAVLESPTRKKRPSEELRPRAQRLSYANRDIVEEMRRERSKSQEG